MIGIFGGTFDPVHLGHLGLARTAAKRLELEKVIFVPLGIPPHRAMPAVSATDRLIMLRAALAPYERYAIDTSEIEKQTPSWTIETLAHFARNMPEQTLCLLMGADAFRSIDQWHRWQSLLDYAHIAVIERKGHGDELNTVVAEFLLHHQVDGLPSDIGRKAGAIFRLEGDVPEVSSSMVRDLIKAGKPVDKLLPPEVAGLIMENGFYGYR